MPRRFNPTGVAPALRYWHGAEVAPNSRDVKPCSTFLVVASLSEPEYQIEIEAVAAKA